jgi:hypothetical protein
MKNAGQSDNIEMWPLTRLRAHPENAAIFGQPDESGKFFQNVLASIRENGIWEPLIVKVDGTILAGHVRRACAEKLGLARVPVRVRSVASLREELLLLVRSNTDRRQLTQEEIGRAHKRLKATPQEDGGAKRKMGRPPKGEEKSATSRTLSRSRDESAAQLGVSRDVADACETVFTTPGVPAVVKGAVKSGRVGVTTAAKEIRKEVKRQGGELTSGEPLVAKFDPNEWDKRPAHVKRLQAEADKFQEDCDALQKAHDDMDRVLKRRPLATLLGPTDHEDYRDLIEQIGHRVYLELHGGEMKPKATLTAIDGGKE